jgi:hypothetical protein
MKPAIPSNRLVDSLATLIIAVVATVLALGSLQVGRHLVQAAGERAVRTALVQESDRIASQSMAELDERNGCRELRRIPFQYQTCVGLASLVADSLRVSVRIQPRNRLVGPDSVLFTIVRESQ